MNSEAGYFVKFSNVFGQGRARNKRDGDVNYNIYSPLVRRNGRWRSSPSAKLAASGGFVHILNAVERKVIPPNGTLSCLSLSWKILCRFPIYRTIESKVIVSKAGESYLSFATLKVCGVKKCMSPRGSAKLCWSCYRKYSITVTPGLTKPSAYPTVRCKCMPCF